ncbi:MAG: GGDEF domain-containing protein [Acidobacteriia bacterium]|jgi:diguanylate cyclase (GGDEF)-like protein|nr:GGDEF domain-containing protein [Terriglobia bacterium]
MSEIQAKLRRLERRDWWLWWTAIAVMLLLTAGVVSLSYPTLVEEDSVLQQQLDLAVRGLVGLVLLFNLYSIYQQILIKRLRRQLAESMEAMIRLEMRAKELHHLAMHDPLTGLYNRRFAEQRLQAETNRSQRHGHSLSVLLFDLNDFKQINDRYGHAAGDLVLKEFADRLRGVLRVSDVAARIGGDEFLALLPDCPPEQLHHLLARLGKMEVQWNGTRLPITYSVGWAGYQSGESPQQMLDRADRALYENKQASKAAPAPVPLFTP